MVQFVEEFSVLQQILADVQALGYSVTSVEQLTPDVIGAWAGSHGFSEIVTDAGTHAGWVRGTNLAEIATATATETATATTTGTAWTLGSTSATVAEADVLVGDVVSATGELVAENVSSTAITNLEMSGLGMAATETGAGATAAAVTLTPKTVVVCGVAAALGLTIGFDVGQAIVAEMEGDDFDWTHDSVGGKIITYLTGDGRTYLNQDLINRMKEYFISQGMYSSGGIVDDNIPVTSNPTEYPHISPAALIHLMCSNFDYTAAGYSYNNYQYLENKCLEILAYMTTRLPALSSYEGFGFQINCGSDKIEMSVHTSPKCMITSSTGYNNNSGGFASFHDNNTNGVYWLRCKCYLYESSTPYNYFETADGSSSGSTQYLGALHPGTTYISAINVGSEVSPVPGVDTKPGATYPTTGTSVDTTYPTWASQRKYIDNPDDIVQDSTKPRTPVLPVQLPFSDPEGISQPDAQNNPNENPDDNTKPIGELKPQPDPDTKIPTDDQGDNDDPDPTTGGGGSGTMGTGMVHIYNPTLAQLAAFSEYLWSGLFDLNTFKKLFQDPMQAIIGLHLLFATPTRDTTDHAIIVGNQNTGCMSRIVTNQYINIDFGKVMINKYFNNVCDYIDTEIELFLPFVGFTQLSAKELVGKKVGLKATIDVLTGTILYKVFNGDQVLYTYAGQCSVQLPLSGANYSSTIASITGLIGAAGVGIATVASGGTLTPVMAAGGAAAAANTATHMSHQVQRSGGIGGNAGAMGPRTPYILVTRHKPYNPSQFNEYYGYPSNIKATLTKCTGYTRVKDVRLHGITATSAELSEIETLLKGGIII